ncbi:MAG: hypothetical protein RLZ98_70 [Pseudomonadota bacterium]|jgi:HlyD family secretion protein
MLKSTLVVAALGLGGFAGYIASTGTDILKAAQTSPAPAAKVAATQADADPQWIVAAPGRIEPKSGEIRIAPGIAGRISNVYAKVNDDVVTSEVLIRLDDREARASLAAAEAEAAARQKQRDSDGKNSPRAKINDAEDAVYAAERALTGARFALDEAYAARRSGSGSAREVEDARNRLDRAQNRLQRERVALAVAQSKTDAALPTLFESALARARAQVAAADAVLAKTRIRASINGTVLRLNAKVGEMVAPGPQMALVMIGDTSTLRVKTEIDEGDIAKIKIGQKVMIRSPSHPGQRFAGKVTDIAPALGAPQVGPRGPRRPTDVEVLEVGVELGRDVPLLPGLRVDAFFKELKD